MPTYEYECPQCGEVFEVFHKISDKPLDKCIKCGGKPKKLISGGSGLIFKGTGFYITDYKKKDQKEKKPEKEPPSSQKK